LEEVCAAEGMLVEAAMLICYGTIEAIGKIFDGN